MSLNPRTRMIGIHHAPHGLSPEDLETKYRVLAHAFAAVPIVQKHGLKYEVSFANGKFDKYVRGVKLHASELIVVAIFETAGRLHVGSCLFFCVDLFQSEEKLTEILTDPAFMKVMEGADFLDRDAGATFTVDVLSLLNKPDTSG